MLCAAAALLTRRPRRPQTLAWGPLILGSNHPAINAAVLEAVPRGYGFGAGHAAEVCRNSTMRSASCVGFQ